MKRRETGGNTGTSQRAARRARTPTIQLGRRWTLGNQIGRGGYGRVFEASDDGGILAAAKVIPKVPGADRELLFVDLTGVHNVVPIIDSGEWKDNWVIVMPRATKSLRAHLTERRMIAAEEAVTILSESRRLWRDLMGKLSTAISIPGMCCF
jgi:serine/threonine-protein kinase